LEKAAHKCHEKERNPSLGPVLRSELCHYAAITAIFPSLGANWAHKRTIWRWAQSGANRSLGTIPDNREKYRDF
jgi:hypothetical protein